MYEMPGKKCSDNRSGNNPDGRECHYPLDNNRIVYAKLRLCICTENRKYDLRDRPKDGQCDNRVQNL